MWVSGGLNSGPLLGQQMFFSAEHLSNPSLAFSSRAGGEVSVGSNRVWQT